MKIDWQKEQEKERAEYETFNNKKFTKVYKTDGKINYSPVPKKEIFKTK